MKSAFCDDFSSVHVRQEHSGHVDRAVGILVEFENRYQDARRSDDGIVQRMTEDVLPGSRFVAQVHSSRLEFVESTRRVRFAVAVT